MDLNGKVAIVTGAARGIGRGIALELARAGANIVVADLPAMQEQMDETRALLEKEGRRDALRPLRCAGLAAGGGDA